jgi:hypothetical protein
MPDPIIAIGATATIKLEPSGTPEALIDLYSVTPYGEALGFGNVTELADTKIKRKPGRLDPGRFTMTFTFKDEAPATNQLTTLKTKRDSKALHTVTIDCPGAFDVTTKMFTRKGYIAVVTDPAVEVTDEPMRYQVEFQVSD